MRTRNGADCVYLEVTCADIPAMLRRIEQSGFLIYDIKIMDEMTVGICCEKENLRHIKGLIAKKGAEVRKEIVHGFGNFFKHTLKRPLVLVGMFFLCCLLFVVVEVAFFVAISNTPFIE